MKFYIILDLKSQMWNYNENIGKYNTITINFISFDNIEIIDIYFVIKF